jgi:hypothetical protein
VQVVVNEIWIYSESTQTGCHNRYCQSENCCVTGLNLVTAIEEEFGIKIEDEQITRMLNFKLTVKIVKKSMKE